MIKMNDRNMTSNIITTLREFIGQKLLSVIEYSDGEIYGKLLIFDDGYSMTFSSTGAYWSNGPEETMRILEKTFNKIEIEYGKMKTLQNTMTLVSTTILETRGKTNKKIHGWSPEDLCKRD
jgi:hypothetical protein